MLMHGARNTLVACAFITMVRVLLGLILGAVAGWNEGQPIDRFIMGVIGTIASLVPIPGGSTAVSSVGMSGALAAAGVPLEAAVAAALVNQVVVSYVPALPGWFATKDLLRAQYL